MNKKIKNYIDVLFEGIPKSGRAIELKQELMANCNDRFDDYISQGKTEAQAYSLVVANMGDIDELLQELQPSIEFKKEQNKYIERRARGIAVGVMMYILGVALLLGSSLFDSNTVSIVALCIMFVFFAFATGLIIYVCTAIPQEYRAVFEDKDEAAARLLNERSHGLYGTVNSAYWTLVTAIYLVVSFITGRWDISWLIWLVGAAIGQIIKLIFEMSVRDE